MFGNIVNKKQLINLIDEHKIEFPEFNPNLIKHIHYPLHASAILRWDGVNANGEITTKELVRFNKKVTNYRFSKEEFNLIRIAEKIAPSNDIVGQFIPTSYTVISGFQLTMGRLEHPFGGLDDGDQHLVFGIKNLVNTHDFNIFDSTKPICYVYFIDLRGVGSNINQIDKELNRRIRAEVFKVQRAQDGGVDYELDYDE